MERKNKKAGGKTLWHPAFCEAVRQELSEYGDSLEFKYEHPLNAEPLCIDLYTCSLSVEILISAHA